MVELTLQPPNAVRSGFRLLLFPLSGTPFKFIEALVAAGRPAAALLVQRARGTTTTTRSIGLRGLQEQHVLLQARLQCGLLQEAHSEVRAYAVQVRW